MAKKILISFVDENASVEVELLEDAAPRTCQLIWDNLPISGPCVNAKLCGDMILFPIPGSIKMDPNLENTETVMLVGEVYYWWERGGKYQGWPEDNAEIGWPFGRHNVLTNPYEGATPGNIFGKMTGDIDKFIEVSRRVQKEGVKQVEVRRIEE